MNGKKSKINQGFRSLFHIPSVKRKPTQERVTALQVRVQRMPATTEVVQAREKLRIAADKVFGKLPVNDDTARAKAVEEAVKLCDEVEKSIKNIKALDHTSDKPTAFTKTEVPKNSEALAKGLRKDLQVLKDQVAQLETPKPPAMRVLMPEPDWSTNALLGQITRIDILINSAVVDTARETELREEIRALNKTIGDAQRYVNEANSLVAQYSGGKGLIDQATKALKGLNKKKVANVEQLPLALTLLQFEAALKPGQILNPDGVKSLAKKIEKDLLSLSTDEGAKTYVSDSQAQQKYKENVEVFNGIVSGPLDQLRLLAQPLGLDSWETLSQAVNKARLSLTKPKSDGGTDLSATKLANAVLVDIAKEIKAAQTAAANLSKEVKQLRRELNDLVASVADTRPKPIYASDWLLIDSTLGTINSLLPEDAPSPGDIAKLLAATKPLVEQLTLRVETVAKTRSMYDTFDTDFALFKEQLKAAGKSGAPLKTWDDKAFTDLSASLQKLEKTLPTASAEASFKAWEKLKKDFDDKNKVATEVADYWSTQEPKLKAGQLTYNLMLSGLEGGLTPPKPNAIDVALEALDAARSARPLKLADLQAAAAKCLLLFGAGTPAEIYKAADSSHAEVKSKQEQEAKDKKAAKQVLQDRLYGVDEQVSRAESLVKAVKGESAPVDRIKDLLKKAKQQVKDGDADSANKTMDLIIRRIGLIQAHPEGEPARNRAQLETLNKEWEQVRTKARASLNVVLEKIEEHAESLKGNQDAQNKTKALGLSMTDYRRLFTEGVNPLLAPLTLLADESTPDAGKRQAREQALATVADLQRRMQAHPLTTELAKSPLPAARAVPASLMRVLDRMNFTVLTSVG